MHYIFRIIRLLITLIFIILCACQPESFSIRDYYNKTEFRIPMRDKSQLFTSVYTPKDTSRSYPILLNRTPYRVAPYGEEMKQKLGPSEHLARKGYIFVYQDVRGRFMSEGEFVNMRPCISNKTDSTTIDETSDTYDTIDWLVKNIPNSNGRVGIWGISYPGFYAAMGLIDAHPALKAVAPQAPIADWFVGDDMHHNGAFTLTLNFNFFSVFGKPRPELTKEWPPRFKHGTPDGYRFFLDMGPLPEANKKYFHNTIPFWNEIMKHANYDDFWQSRNILPHLKNVTPAVMVVGGWYDAEDLYGSLRIYQTVEKNNAEIDNHLVMGPWGHGGWARTEGDRLGSIDFGDKTSQYYQQDIELPFFEYYLRGKGEYNAPEARCFDTGLNQWHSFESWPPTDVKQKEFYLKAQNKLTLNMMQEAGNPLYDEYISDPAKPVPFTAEITTKWGKTFMVEDQRFTWRRPDVLSCESQSIDQALTIAGPITATLYVSTSGTDSDWIVKLIDVYPDTFKYENPDFTDEKMGGYQRLIRAEIMRGKFRNSLARPQPMIPGKITEIELELRDIYHTFKKGHRIMVQIQSSWFPLFDRNPQKFVNIYKAKEEDFQKAVQRVYHTETYQTHITVPVLAH